MRPVDGPFKIEDTVVHLIVLIELAPAAAILTAVKALSCKTISRLAHPDLRLRLFLRPPRRNLVTHCKFQIYTNT